MKAYKIWYDTKHYIHKDTTETNVLWTQNINEAKEIPHRGEGLTFFFFTLGFSINGSLPDALHITD